MYNPITITLPKRSEIQNGTHNGANGENSPGFGRFLLKDAEPGSEAKLSAVYFHTHIWPDSLDDVEEHLRNCRECRKKVRRYMVAINAYKTGKRGNKTGWWDPYRTDDLHDCD